METEFKLSNLIKMMAIVLIIIVVFYGITILVMNNKSEENDNSTSIQYEEILIGSIYKVTDEEHYVLVETSEDYLTLNSIVTSYKEKEDSILLYTADLNNTLNKKYYGETSNFESRFPTFKETTLLKIKDNTISEYYEGVDTIKTILE